MAFFQTIPGALILLVVGFVGLIKGADFFVDGASNVAKRFKVPSLIIGLTIVAMGTDIHMINPKIRHRNSFPFWKRMVFIRVI